MGTLTLTPTSGSLPENGDSDLSSSDRLTATKFDLHLELRSLSLCTGGKVTVPLIGCPLNRRLLVQPETPSRLLRSLAD